MTTPFEQGCKLVNELQLEELQQLISIVETRIEKLDNEYWRKVLTNSGAAAGSNVSVTDFTTNYDPVTNKPDSLSVAYGLDDLDIEFEIALTSVTIALYYDTSHIDTWEIRGSPDVHEISDTVYNFDPATQQRIPPVILDYMLFLWKTFIDIFRFAKNVAAAQNNELNLNH